MNELVFLSSKGNPITDSLQVAQVFGKQHKHVLESIRKHIENLNEINDEIGGSDFWLTSYKDIQGKERTKYIMTEEACMSLILTFTTKKALIVQRSYMKEFKRMKEYIQNQQQVPTLSPMEQIAQALTLADNIIKDQQAQLDEQKPKVEFANSICDSDNLILIGDLAKLLTQNGYKIGQNNLFKKLREEGYLHKNSKRPTQRSMNMGLFRIVEHKPKEGFSMEPTTKVTGKGQEYFINKFLKELDER